MEWAKVVAGSCAARERVGRAEAEEIKHWGDPDDPIQSHSPRPRHLSQTRDLRHDRLVERLGSLEATVVQEQRASFSALEAMLH